MANLSINLLPQELTAAKVQRQKASLVVQVCVFGLVLLIVAAGIILSFRFAQGAQLSKVQSEANDVKEKITSPQNNQKEGLVVTLKSRLDSLNQVNGQSYPAAYIYSIIAKMIPPSLNLTAFTVDKKGKSLIQVDSPDSATLALFLNNLMDPQQNQQKVTSATVQSIGLNKNNTISASLSVNLVGGSN